ncbi:MAG: nicotinamidase [Burkholderiales bacterium]|nr:Nicotinamidase [Rhodocyclaceae bacterium]MCZ2174602.1 nicotinamidase [Burkholderiales bacterium]HNQ58045.1 nicotinamidase [Candidatus Desulfobacillus denitrificans]MCQ3924463.1 nicotinamidase [Rhodocyclaceae bacterium]MCZ2420599.1 nicotinamidase [Burkholderiales bacterium]
MIGDGVHLQAGDALILVDVQLDFLPGGSLAVPRGDEVVPALNRYIAVFRGLTFPIVATRDWHPPDHCSFRAQGGPWPPHCVAGSAGAHFATLLDLPCEAHIVSKATSRDRDAYSGFEGTGLDDWLRRAGASRVFVGGLATDYCVLNTVRDALRFGYATFLLLDAVRAVDVAAGDGARAIDEMRRLGAMAIEYGQVAA